MPILKMYHPDPPAIIGLNFSRDIK